MIWGHDCCVLCFSVPGSWLVNNNDMIDIFGVGCIYACVLLTLHCGCPFQFDDVSNMSIVQIHSGKKKKIIIRRTLIIGDPYLHDLDPISCPHDILSQLVPWVQNVNLPGMTNVSPTFMVSS